MTSLTRPTPPRACIVLNVTSPHLGCTGVPVSQLDFSEFFLPRRFTLLPPPPPSLPSLFRPGSAFRRELLITYRPGHKEGVIVSTNQHRRLGYLSLVCRLFPLFFQHIFDLPSRRAPARLQNVQRARRTPTPDS